MITLWRHAFATFLISSSSKSKSGAIPERERREVSMIYLYVLRIANVILPSRFAGDKKEAGCGVGKGEQQQAAKKPLVNVSLRN